MSTICTSAYSHVSTPTPRSLTMKFGARAVAGPKVWKIHTTRPKKSVNPSNTARMCASRSGVSQSYRSDTSLEAFRPAMGGTMTSPDRVAVRVRQLDGRSGQSQYMAGVARRLRAGDSRPDENHAANGSALFRIELRRHGRSARIDLDPLHILWDDVIDVEIPCLHAVHPVLRRAVPRTLSAAESEGSLSAAANRGETRTRNHAHHVAEVHRIALLDLIARHEVAEAARLAIVEVAQHLASARRLLDGHAFDSRG